MALGSSDRYGTLGQMGMMKIRTHVNFGVHHLLWFLE
jgi:hypothetical protein